MHALPGTVVGAAAGRVRGQQPGPRAAATQQAGSKRCGAGRRCRKWRGAASGGRLTANAAGQLCPSTRGWTDRCRRVCTHPPPGKRRSPTTEKLSSSQGGDTAASSILPGRRTATPPPANGPSRHVRAAFAPGGNGPCAGRRQASARPLPDGRSVGTLINAAAVPAAEAKARSVVATEDLAPPDEVEPLRAAFPGLVRRELRAPLAAVRDSKATLLEAGAALDPAGMREFHRITVEQAGHLRSLISGLLDAGRIDAGTLPVPSEPTEAAELVERAPGTFLGGGGRHPGTGAAADEVEHFPFSGAWPDGVRRARRGGRLALTRLLHRDEAGGGRSAEADVGVGCVTIRVRDRGSRRDRRAAVGLAVSALSRICGYPPIHRRSPAASEGRHWGVASVRPETPVPPASCTALVLLRRRPAGRLPPGASRTYPVYWHLSVHPRRQPTPPSASHPALRRLPRLPTLQPITFCHRRYRASLRSQEF